MLAFSPPRRYNQTNIQEFPAIHSSEEDSLMTDEALLCRVERLERSYLWWKRIGVTATAAAIVLLILTTHAYSQRKPGENRLDPPPPDAATTPSDDKTMITYYANFFRVTGTTE